MSECCWSRLPCTRSVLGVIPARGGSKGVSRKNIRPVAGKPLIAYTIEAARASRLLTRFVASTEDAEIAAVARSLGCDVLPRPSSLAADNTPMPPVVMHALSVLEEAGHSFSCVAVLQPTTPLRIAEDIDRALGLLFEGGCDSVVSVYQVADEHPARMYRLVDGYLVAYEREPEGRMRQSLPPVYHRNGAVYACRRELLIEKGTLIGARVVPHIMPRERSINIDDEMDLAFADWLLQRQQTEAQP